MSQEIKVFYNGANLFDYQPVPFIGLDEQPISFGGRWGIRENIIFNGQLTGCTFDSVFESYNELKAKLASQLGTLEIWQIDGSESGQILKKDSLEIESFSIPQDRWIGVLPYEIRAACYPEEYFSGAWGILDPQDSWSFTEQQNATLEATHTISCRGFDGKNALENARNWALARTGTNSAILPAMISGVSVNNFFLVSQAETINRLDGSYSFTEVYANDLARSGYGIIRYNTDFNSGSNLIAANIVGEIRGRTKDIIGPRAAYSQLDRFAIVAQNYNRIFSRDDLNPIPLEYSVNENPYEGIISFSEAYDTNNRPESYFDYMVSLASGTMISARIEGDVISRGGDPLARLEKSKTYASTLNLYALTTEFYNEFYPYHADFPLNAKAVSSGISVNEFEGTVSLNAEFNNLETQKDGIDSMAYVLQFSPAIKKIDSQPILDADGAHSTIYLGYANRAALAINGDAVISNGFDAESGLAIIKAKCQELMLQNAGPKIILEQNSIGYSDKDQRRVSFNFAWSFEKPDINPNFDNILLA